MLIRYSIYLSIYLSSLASQRTIHITSCLFSSIPFQGVGGTPATFRLNLAFSVIFDEAIDIDSEAVAEMSLFRSFSTKLQIQTAKRMRNSVRQYENQPPKVSWTLGVHLGVSAVSCAGGAELEEENTQLKVAALQP